MREEIYNLTDLRLGDCREVMRDIPGASIDAIVTDPPYELGFMGKAWDRTGIAYDPAVWEQALRVLKPGGHLLSFGGSRTYHRMACAIEDAGFEIRDQIMWIYGSGFPKSHDISKAIDKAAGANNVIGTKPDRWTGKGNSLNFSTDRPQAEAKITAPATPAAMQWQGWGTALKPAHEPIAVARKPFAGTVAANVLEYGTGGINVDGCRVAHGEACRVMPPSQANINNPSEKHRQAGRRNAVLELKPSGRWPANVIHDGSEEVLEAFAVAGEKGGGFGVRGKSTRIYGGGNGFTDATGETVGSAARFFYCAKASSSERAGNNHPTIKPLALMRHLCRLVTPPGGTVLDPFAGSGSTLIAASLEGFSAIGIERDPDNHAGALSRLSTTSADHPLFPGTHSCVSSPSSPAPVASSSQP